VSERLSLVGCWRRGACSFGTTTTRLERSKAQRRARGRKVLVEQQR
jgi:hypothetical protein